MEKLTGGATRRIRHMVDTRSFLLWYKSIHGEPPRGGRNFVDGEAMTSLQS
jgi:hypothetical protein